MTDNIFVVNRSDVLVGLLFVIMLVADPGTLVRDIMVKEFDSVLPETPKHDVASMFERYNLVSSPVVDEEHRLLGRITIDDVVNVIIDEADHSILGMAGLNETDDQFALILKTARNRAIRSRKPYHCLYRRRCDRSLQRYDRESGGTGGADAYCCEHGGSCRQSDIDSCHQEHGAK